MSARDHDGSGPAGGLGPRLAAWLPLAAILVLFSQIALLGLKPTVQESHELDWKAEFLHSRLAGCEAELAELEAWITAQDDPIYRERVRRLALDAGPPFDPWQR